MRLADFIYKLTKLTTSSIGDLVGLLKSLLSAQLLGIVMYMQELVQ